MPKGHLNQLYRGTIVYRIRISKKKREREIFPFRFSARLLSAIIVTARQRENRRDLLAKTNANSLSARWTRSYYSN